MASPFRTFFLALTPEEAARFFDYLDATPDAAFEMIEEIAAAHGKALTKLGFLARPTRRRKKLVEKSNHGLITHK